MAQCTEDADPEEPKTLDEALSGLNRTQWLSAIHAEVRSLRAKGVYRLVDRAPKMKVLGGKWVFKLKRDQDGNIMKFKARYVVKGFMQRFGVDYTNTYANVANIDTIRLLLAMTCFYNWECDTIDIVTAFLNGDLEEEVYMDQIEGFEEDPKKVCMLLKSLYGLKQAPRAWQQSFYKHLRKLGCTQLRTDSAVFIRRTNGIPVIIMIHVDDMAIMSPSRDLVDEFKRQLAEKFEIEDNGPISSFLGLKVTRNRTTRTLELSQKTYIESVVKEFLHGELVNSKPTPLEPNQRLEPNQDPVDEKLRTEYQQLVGSLMWLAMRTRLDIAYHVSILSRFLQNPSKSHWGAAKRVLRYLHGTKHFVITYSGRNSTEINPELELGLQAFSDASFAMVQSKHSQSGFVCFAAGGPIAWYSSKQPIITLSSTEAEYVGLVTAARSVLSMSNLLVELGYYGNDRIPFQICGDNINALNAADNSGAIRSIKHLELRWRWLQQETAANRIKLEYVPGQEHPADGLTKSLTKPKHEQFVKLLGFRT
jgi:hypothetical protein